VLEVTAFTHPTDFGDHFKASYGPTIAALGNASRDGREHELCDEIDRFSRDWNLGSEDAARFEMEYLLAVGMRT